MRSFAKISFQFSSAISVRNSGLRAYLKSRSQRQKVHFFNCQTRHFPGHWKPRHLGYKPETNRVSVHDLHVTLFHLLGVDHQRLTCLHNGRSYRLTDVACDVLRKILA